MAHKNSLGSRIEQGETTVTDKRLIQFIIALVLIGGALVGFSIGGLLF